MVDVSKNLDILTWVQADTASAVCGLSLTPITFAAVICDADGPCLVNAAYEPESTFTMPHSEYNHVLGTFGTWVPTPSF